MDRDQWTGILHAVSAVTAYRWLYKEGLAPWQVAELLVLRSELPRSLTASIQQVVALLTNISQQTGQQGEADRLARRQLGVLRRTTASSLIQDGMHEYLLKFLRDLVSLDHAISQQFRFV